MNGPMLAVQIPKARSMQHGWRPGGNGIRGSRRTDKRIRQWGGRGRAWREGPALGRLKQELFLGVQMILQQQLLLGVLLVDLQEVLLLLIVFGLLQEMRLVSIPAALLQQEVLLRRVVLIQQQMLLGGTGIAKKEVLVRIGRGGDEQMGAVGRCRAEEELMMRNAGMRALQK